MDSEKAMYTMPLIVESEYCGRNQFIRTSSLLSKCQTMASIHLDALGENRTDMFEKGLFWVIIRTNAEIIRLPRYAEKVILKTWTGRVRFSLFPRFHEVTTEDGEVLIRISSTWGVINAETRKFVSSDEHGLADFIHSENGTEIPQKVKLPKNAFEDESKVHSYSFTVPYSYVDINGHMNNTRYLDVADNILPSPNDGRTLKKFYIEYENEIKQDAQVTVKWTELEEGKYYMEGSTDKTCYKLMLEY